MFGMTSLRAARRWPLQFLLLAILATACQSQCRLIGDAPRFDVVIANRTDQRVEVAISGAMSGTQNLSLGPREEQRATKSWFYPESESDLVTVRATATSGAPIFCKQYSYRALRDVTFYIEIQLNVLAC